MLGINGIRSTITSAIQGFTKAVTGGIPLDLGGLMSALGGKGRGAGADMASASRSANTLLQRELDKLRQMS